MMVLLLGNANGDFCLREDLLSELSRLGVTHIALVRDQETVGIVLEGWLFDPARSADAAAAAVGARAGARALHPILHAAVTAVADEGGRDVQDAQTACA